MVIMYCLYFLVVEHYIIMQRSEKEAYDYEIILAIHNESQILTTHSPRTQMLYGSL